MFGFAARFGVDARERPADVQSREQPRVLMGLDPSQARARLLPEHIPLRFFASASVFHVLAWVAVFLAAEELPEFRGGPGPELAAVHVLTVGVLLMTAMGVTFQMLPVALGRPAPSAGTCSLAFLLLLAAAAVLVAGFGLYDARLLQAGAVLASAAVLIHVAATARVVLAARSHSSVVASVWIALVSMVSAVVLATALAFGSIPSFLPGHAEVALAHAILAAFGFMGMLAIGLSDVVVPLFAMTFVADHRWNNVAIGLAAAALALVVAGILIEVDALVGAGILCGLAAAGCHARAMTQALSQRMRKRLGPEFVLIRASWCLMPLPMLIGGGLLFDIVPDSGPALFGFALLYGWLLTLLLGVLQRIIPLLASMHAAREGGMPILPTQLVSEPPLRIHRWCHLTALAGVGVGLALEVPLVIQAGALMGVAGAISFLIFALVVLRRMSSQRGKVAARGAAHEGNPNASSSREVRTP